MRLNNRFIGSFLVLLTMFLIAFFAPPLMAQGAEWTPPDLKHWFDNFDVVYGAIVVIGGYLSRVIPGLKLMPGVYRVATIAVLTIGAFFLFGWNKDVFQMILTYLLSTSFYELFLQPFNKKKKLNT